jgi:hypothetical protein
MMLSAMVRHMTPVPLEKQDRRISCNSRRRLNIDMGSIKGQAMEDAMKDAMKDGSFGIYLLMTTQVKVT